MVITNKYGALSYGNPIGAVPAMSSVPHDVNSKHLSTHLPRLVPSFPRKPTCPVHQAARAALHMQEVLFYMWANGT